MRKTQIILISVVKRRKILECLSQRDTEPILALRYVETDELLNAFLILLLGGTASWVLTWLSKGSLRLSHLLVHPGQTQPGGREAQRNVQRTFRRTFIVAGVFACENVQRDYVRVGLLDRDAQGVLARLVLVVLRRPSLQE